MRLGPRPVRRAAAHPRADPGPPTTLAAGHELARWTGQAGNAAGARDQYAAMLPMRERAQRPDHPDTLTVRHELVQWTGQAEKAAPDVNCPRQGLQAAGGQDRARGRPRPGPLHPGPDPACAGVAAGALAGREQPRPYDRERDLPDDRPPGPAVRRGCLAAPDPAPFQPHSLDRGGAEGDLMELNGWSSPQMLRGYGASARSARARRTYDRIMAGSP
jgi:hypothetical protein